MNEPILALVVPCYNEELVLAKAVQRLDEIIKALVIEKTLSIKSYIVFVDDGSKDETWELIESFAIKFNNIRGIKLSRNYGHQNALLAGMESVVDRCDCMISIDADLQQDENSISVFIKKYLDGCDVVLGVRNNRKTDSIFKKLTAICFYQIMAFMGVNLKKNHADFRLLSNRANKYLLAFKEVNLFLRGLIPLLGFKTDYVYFDVKDRCAGESKYTLLKMLSFAIEGITSFSVTPLRVISVLGLIVFFASFFMSIYIVAIAMLTNNVIPGWASTVLPIYFIGGIQLLSIGVLGEYVGKIYIETKKRPRYFVEKEF